MNKNEHIKISDADLMAFITNELDKDNKQKIANWIALNDENKKRFESVFKAWEITGTIEPKPVLVNTENAWNTVLDKIGEEKGKILPIKAKSNKKIYLSIAAMIVVLIGVFSILKFSSPTVENENVFANTHGLIDGLSDGSIVTLNKNSSLIYPKEFLADERRVSMQGEAFFEIERNIEKPFIIDLPANAYVKVLGTSFNIKATEGDSICEVFVSEGKVEFGNDSNKIILIAGQKGILNTITGNFYLDETKSVGIKEMYWIDEKIVFDNLPMEEVVDVLSNIFEIKVTLECENLKKELHRSGHNGESLKEILEVISNTQGFNVIDTLKGNQQEFMLICNE